MSDLSIAVDCRYVRVGRHDGISRYTAGLVTALARRHPVTMLISDPRQREMLPDLPWYQVSAPTGPREPLVARQVRRLRPDVVFSPMQTMGSAGRDYALVLTVHDLIYYRHGRPPRDLPAPVRALWRLYHLAWWPQRLLLNRADAVVAVSETTEALIGRHRLTRRPVTVVPNAPDPLPGGEPRTEPHRIVYMGSFMPYKDVDTLVRAAALLPDHELHLMSRVTDAEKARLTALAPAARLVFRGGASDEEYATALRGATALVTASRDEGFGIPLVEAMSVGTPVVCTDIPVFREVGGDSGGATYVAAGDAEGFAAAVRALDHPDRRPALEAAARQRAAAYSWDASAEVLLDLLHTLPKPRRRRRW